MLHVTHPDSPAAARQRAQRRIAYRSWEGEALRPGEHAGTGYTRGAVVLASPAGAVSYTDPFVSHAAAQDFEYAHWTTEPVTVPFAFTDLIASWQVKTPEGTWVEIAVQVHGTAGASSWLTLARWAGDDSTVHPTSVPGQREATGRISTDAWLAADGNRGLSYRLRVTMLRPAGTELFPTLTYLGAVVSALPTPGEPSRHAGVVRTLELPQYSQQIHAGQYPHWDGGGNSWCSPTSTSMVMHYWTDGPYSDEYAWVEPHYENRHIHHAVRHCFDYSYGGAGNWSFNTAYASQYGLNAFVTRLRDLTEAEAFIAAGIPLVASIRVIEGELDGAGYTTQGHIVVVAGFTETGDVVCHDPAAPTPGEVRRVYRRDQFELAWLGASGGIVYVIHNRSVPLPPPPAEANW
ncbi:C39 family peptidase [Longispora albida]|uniref:C39 family peptidase n=1 Tax=Longispora albida TaxID=203523 RepID=UPI00037B3EDF|nr:C39 family peptidase [Longispora albida]